jgi:hypothetical protein
MSRQSSNSTSVHIWWDLKIDAYKLSTSYNQVLIDTLKNAIPVSDWDYDKQSRTWTFAEKYLDKLLPLFQLLNITPHVTTRAQAQAHDTARRSGPLTQRSSVDTVIIEFVKLTPFDAMLKAYRAAQMTLHPDRGGDPDKSARLNAAWERVKKEVYNQS